MIVPFKKDKITQELCDFYEADLFEFAKYINPHYMYDDIHEEVFRELQYNKEENQMYLIPRGHLKSHCIAVWTVWNITKKPWTSMVYLTAGQDLAEVQMYAIQQMLLSQEYQDLWPEMILPNENDRDKGTNTALNVDHPTRATLGIRDYTLIVKTIKSNATGLHCDDLVLDDIVVPGNAYTRLGRREVEKAVSEFVAIKNPGAQTRCVGTHYTEKDIYYQFEEAMIPVFDEQGDIVDEKPLWFVMNRAVEKKGDGNGKFLWPRVQCPKTGRWYGFDRNELARKKAEMLSAGNNLAHFWAQYYNETNSKDQLRAEREYFTYYDKKHLRFTDDGWYYRNKKLKLGAGMDLAYNENEGSGDYTAIAIIGIDEEGFIYLLDIIQFKTTKNSIYYRKLMDLHDYWGFRRVHVDQSGSGKVIIRELQRLIREEGRSLAVKGVTYGSQDGAKEERFAAVLEPRYEAGTVLHYKGGYIPTLEDQVMKPRPANDDLEDSLFIAVDNTKPPARGSNTTHLSQINKVVVASHRFGGRRRVR